MFWRWWWRMKEEPAMEMALRRFSVIWRFYTETRLSCGTLAVAESDGQRSCCATL
jgi:hypothetical protein